MLARRHILCIPRPFTASAVATAAAAVQFTATCNNSSSSSASQHQQQTKPPLQKPYIARPGDSSDPDKQKHVPDRLRDAFAFYGSDVSRAEPDDGGDIPYRSPEQRKQMMQGMMGMHSHTISLSSLDKVRNALDAVRRREPSHDDWRHLNALLRNSEMCIELLEEPGDQFPPGDKLWVHLSETQVRRRPYVLHFRECGNTFCVLPVFTQEEYMTHYFQRMKTHDSCWFPTPRMGSQRKEYQRQKFPVCAHGPLAKLCALAIHMTPAADETFVMCINPFQASTKFITYPEMIKLAKAHSDKEKEDKEKAQEARNKPGAMFPRSQMFMKQPPASEEEGGQQQQQSKQPPIQLAPENMNQIAARLQERQAQLARQQQKVMAAMDQADRAAAAPFESKKDKRERLLREHDEKVKKQQEQGAAAAAGQEQQQPDILFEPPKSAASAENEASLLDSSRKIIAEINERERITRETLRKIKMDKVTSSDGSTAGDIHFSKIFDTTKWWGRRLTPDEAQRHARGEIPFPEVEELRKRIKREVPNIGRTVAQEERESEAEAAKQEEQQEEEARRLRKERDEQEEAEFIKAMSEKKFRNLGFATDSLREKLPQFHQLRKPPPPRKHRTEDDFRPDPNKNKDGKYSSEYDSDELLFSDAESSSRRSKLQWAFPVQVPVSKEVAQFWSRKLAEKNLDPAKNMIRGVRVPRIALDELLLLLFDVPHVKFVVASLVLSSSSNENSSGSSNNNSTKIKLQVALVTTDPVVLLEAMARKEGIAALDEQRAWNVTQDIEQGAADGRAKVELTWSFPKNKSNSPYDIEFVSITTTDFFTRVINESEENEKNQQQQQQQSFAVLYDRGARGAKELEASRVTKQPCLREELDYDGEEMDVIEWHKQERPFWGLSRST